MLDIQTAIDTINKVNSRHSAILISTFDFSSLFINIPHHKLKSVIEELVNFCFNGRNEKCIGIFGYGATWTNNQQKYRLSNNKKYRFSFNKISLKLAITYWTIVNKPCVLYAFVSYLESLGYSTQMLLW